MFNKHHTKETKRRMRLAKLGKTSNRKGCYHTKETKEKISQTRIKLGLSKGKNNNMYGKTHTKRARKCISEGNSIPKANLICKHHIDLNKDNNKINNKLSLTNSKHIKLHSNAYKYLVRIGKVDNYIKWFDREYGLK